MTALPIVLMTEEEVASFGRASDAGFGALGTERVRLPLAAMDVDVRVAGVLASIELAQTFVNTTGTAIEATYIFPLADRAAVHRFRMEVAGRVIEGMVDERGAAREQYDEAIAAGHRAAITEQERPGVFTLRVGNLMPGESATIRLSIVGPLAIDDGEVTFRFPLVVAPRYIPGYGLPGDQAGLGTSADTDLVPDASRISPPVRLPGCPNPVRLGLRVALEDRVRDVASSLHAVTTALRDAHVVEVQPGERLDRDFILRWHVDGSELASSLVCADDADGRGGTFVLTVVPPSTATVAAKPRDVVFVLDRSGSMEGWKMLAARRALARMIDTLTSRDRFHVIAFDNAIEVLPDIRPVPANDRNRFCAVETLAKIDARGGTELAAPLQIAAKLLAGGQDDRERVIVLVTDGQVGNEDHILRDLAPHLRNVRVFTLGIDQAVNETFLKRLAGAGGGLCELVESEDRLDAVMAKVHRRIGTPVATELALRATAGFDVDRATIAPRKLPDVYAGAPIVVLGRYRGRAPERAAFELEATSLGDPMRATVMRGSAAIDARTPGWLAASWARAYIRELEDRYAVGAHEVEPEIVAVSKRFGVLSRFTAYLAVDRSEIANPGGRLKQVVQSVDSPAGWSQDVTESAPSEVRQFSRSRGSFTGAARPAPMRSLAGMAPRAARLLETPPGAPSAPPALSQAKRRGPPPPPAAATVTPPASPAKPPAPAPSPAMPAMAPQYMGNPYASRPGGSGSFDELSASQEEGGETDPSAYLTSLGALARELEQQMRGRRDPAAVRLIRQRLTEWVEDVRSVGGLDALASAVERHIKRLSAAIAAGAPDPDIIAIAIEIGKLAGGTPPRSPRGRVEFWK